MFQAMNNKDESWNLMGVATRDYLDLNATITSTLPGFGMLFSQFSDNMIQMQVIREKRETDTTGIADTKRQLRVDLVARALDVSLKTTAYAKMTHNSTLLKEVYYPETKLRMSSGSTLKDRALLIHDKAEANLKDLEPYGITPESLAALKQAIELFNASIPKPRLILTEKKQATDQLANLIKSSKAILEMIDSLVDIVRLSHPMFYAGYWNNRRVIGTGKGSLALKALVTDADTKAGIKGVKVSFACKDQNVKLATAKNDKPLMKVTAEKGRFRIKTLTAGTYMVTLNKPGYTEKVIPVNVADSETTELVVELERN
jgi:hypothetical protein